MTHVGKFKIAVIGVSTESAKEFLPEIFYSQTTKLVAVCDENCESLKQICEAYMISGYHSYNDLIENEEIDFAVTTVLPRTHIPNSTLCKRV
jgi:predicted dehydrogenase